MSVATATPPATKAAMVRAVLAEKHPRLALGDIAHRFHVSLADLQTILNQNGYPERGPMQAAANRLEAESAAGPSDPDDGRDTKADPPTGRRLVEVDVNKIQTDPDNPREHLTGIDELADSIAQVGLLQPIVCRRTSNGTLIVVAGHRRLAAVRLLRRAKVDVIVDADMRPDEVLAAMLIENGQRADLDPIEEARGLHRLKAQLDCSETELGQKIGRSQTYVNGRLMLLQLSAEDQAAIRAGELGVVAGTQKARIDAGRVNNNARGRIPRGLHLSVGHGLADHARARCTRLQHSRGKSVGGIACGECWESVIRADEREHLQELISSTGTCPVCGTKHLETGGE